MDKHAIEITVMYYAIKSNNGETDYAVSTEPADYICVGLFNDAGEHRQFESEARHLRRWAKEEGFNYASGEIVQKVQVNWE